jgi:hypothetical protein
MPGVFSGFDEILSVRLSNTDRLQVCITSNQVGQYLSRRIRAINVSLRWSGITPITIALNNADIVSEASPMAIRVVEVLRVIVARSKFHPSARNGSVDVLGIEQSSRVKQ